MNSVYQIVVQIMQSILLFFHSYRLKSIKIDLASQYLEISLFWTITYAIAEIYYTVKPYQQRKRRYDLQTSINRIMRNIFLVNIVVIAILLTLGMFGIPLYRCKSRYGFQWYFVSIQQLFIAITCIIYSRKLIKEIRIEEVEEQNNERLKMFIKLESTDQLYYQERVSQLKLVIFTLILSSLIDLLLDLVTQVLWDYDFKCVNHEYYKPITTIGKIDCFIRFLLQAIPSIMIPYIFYVLPIRNRSKENFDLQQEDLKLEKQHQIHLFVEDSDAEEHQDIINCKDPKTCTHNHRSKKKQKSWVSAADDLRRLKKKIICKQCDDPQNDCESECGSDTCIKKDKIDSLDFAHQKIQSFSKSFTDKYQLSETHIHDNCPKD